MIEITHGVPLPVGSKKKRNRKSERQEAIGKLEVGQSFWLKATVNSASSLLWWASAKYPERGFICDSEKDGVRVWRTK